MITEYPYLCIMTRGLGAKEEPRDDQAHSATKLVLRFLTGAQFFELFFFVSSQELILDFGTWAAMEGIRNWTPKCLDHWQKNFIRSP